ncbi:hypothetical protein V6N13_115928 [Hibiscus sabdariffa]|uniref:Uncharacterized protein n=1 Tax=Hibiscus sabdariffa TaxID=183260 RepID=A0ABR1ZHL5_9ROSI
MDIVERDVKENPEMIYMKGVPDFAQCGLSSLAVRVIKHLSHVLKVPRFATFMLYQKELWRVENDTSTLIHEVLGLLQYRVTKDAIGKLISF